eukprot:766817-Hanusia_phi.AAC.1
MKCPRLIVRRWWMDEREEEGEELREDAVISLQQLQCLTFGRDARSDVRLPWEGISRAHAWMDLHKPRDDRSGGSCRWQIVCNGSPNGLFVNRRRVNRHCLAHGDVIGFAHGHNTKLGEELESAAFVYEFVFEEVTDISKEQHEHQQVISEQSNILEGNLSRSISEDFDELDQQVLLHLRATNINDCCFKYVNLMEKSWKW